MRQWSKGESEDVIGSLSRRAVPYSSIHSTSVTFTHLPQSPCSHGPLSIPYSHPPVSKDNANTPGKLGLLPKKKVDLLSSSPGGSTTNLAPGHTAGSASTAGAGTGANAGTAFGGEHADHDPNPALPSAKASIISKIPATPPAGARGGRGYEDSDDELEYTR